MNQLTSSFQTAMAEKTPKASEEYFREFFSFMAERSPRPANGLGQESWTITVGTSMLLAAVLPPQETLALADRKEILLATSASVNELDGISGRAEVRFGMRSLERFLYKTNTFRSSPLHLAFQDRAMSADWAAYDRVRDLRHHHTADLAHKPLGQLAIERFDSIAAQIMPEGMSDTALSSYMTQYLTLDARRSLEGS